MSDNSDSKSSQQVAESLLSKISFGVGEITFVPTQTNLVDHSAAEKFFTLFCDEHFKELRETCPLAYRSVNIRDDLPTIGELERIGLRHLTIEYLGVRVGYVLYMDPDRTGRGSGVRIDTIFITKILRTEAFLQEVYRRTVDLFFTTYPRISTVTLLAFSEDTARVDQILACGFTPERTWFSYARPGIPDEASVDYTDKTK